MVVSGGAVSPENRSNEEKIAALARWLDYQFESPSIGNQVRAIGAWLAEVESERGAALARIAAVEALHFTRGRNILGKPVCAECSPLQPMPCPTLRALAASPTPTGPEPATECEHGQTEGHSFYVTEGRDWDHSAEYATCPGPATPEPTEETL